MFVETADIVQRFRKLPLDRQARQEALDAILTEIEESREIRIAGATENGENDPFGNKVITTYTTAAQDALLKAKDVIDTALSGSAGTLDDTHHAELGNHLRFVERVSRLFVAKGIDGAELQNKCGALRTQFEKLTSISPLVETETVVYNEIERRVLQKLESHPEVTNYEAALNFLNEGSAHVVNPASPEYKPLTQVVVNDEPYFLRNEDVPNLDEKQIKAYVDLMNQSRNLVRGEYARREALPFQDRALEAWNSLEELDSTTLLSTTQRLTVLGFTQDQYRQIPGDQLIPSFVSRLVDLQEHAKEFTNQTGKTEIEDFLIGVAVDLKVPEEEAYKAFGKVPPGHREPSLSSLDADPVGEPSTPATPLSIQAAVVKSGPDKVDAPGVSNDAPLSPNKEGHEKNQRLRLTMSPADAVYTTLLGSLAGVGAYFTGLASNVPAVGFFTAVSAVGTYLVRKWRERSKEKQIHKIATCSTFSDWQFQGTAEYPDGTANSKIADVSAAWVLDNPGDRKKGYVAINCVTSGHPEAKFGGVGADIVAEGFRDAFRKWNRVFESDLTQEASQNHLRELFDLALKEALAERRREAKRLKVDGSQLACSFGLAISTPNWVAVMTLGDVSVVYETRASNGMTFDGYRSQPIASLEEVIKEKQGPRFNVYNASAGTKISGITLLTEGISNQVFDSHSNCTLRELIDNSPEKGRTIAGMRYIAGEIMYPDSVPANGLPSRAVSMAVHNDTL